MYRLVDPQNSARDVVITGLGAVTPFGSGVRAAWECLLNGKRAGRELQSDEIDHFDQLAEFLEHTPLGAPAHSPTVDPSLVAHLKQQASIEGLIATWNSEPFVGMLVNALTEAACDAQIELPVASPERTGCVIGASKGGLRTLEQLVRESTGHVRSGDSVRHTTPDWRWDYAAASDATVRAAALLTGATAGQSSPVAACASGLISILQAAMWIRRGDCDLCFAGSSDAALRASVQSAYHRLRVISRNTDGQTACRPFDLHRDGFIIGEGAGVVVLESREHAMRRGIRPLASLAAGGWLTDTLGMTQISSDGSAVSELMTRVLRNTPDDTPVDWINLHGTGTRSNDLAESAAVRHTFRDATPAVASWKGATGHLLGAAGSVETCLTIASLSRRTIPASANFESFDPDCGIRPNNQNIAMPSMRRAMKLSLGFGGHIACAIIDREDDRPSE